MAAKRGALDAKSSLRALATDTLAPFKREPVTVPEWENAKLVVRAMTGGDWIDYRAEIARARQKAIKDSGIAPDDLAAENEQLRDVAEAASALLDGIHDAGQADGLDAEALMKRISGRVTNLKQSIEAAVTGPVLPNMMPATALVLVRTLYDEAGSRVLSDQDIPAVAASFSDVHGRLADKAFALSGFTGVTDPVQDAGNG